MSGVRFGTDGIRGEAGVHPITPEVGRRLGAAVVRALGVPEFHVARDTRAHGEALAVAVCEGAAGAGARVMFHGVWPTPALACELSERTEGAAIMVTASHNAHRDNGFKVLVRGGRKPRANQILKIEEALNHDALGSPKAAVAIPRQAAPLAWLAALREEAKSVGTAWEGRRIAFDFAHGAACPWREELTGLIPAHWVVRGGGEGSINEGVGSEAIDTLREAVVTETCDVGFAVDGDGDRLRVVDERGEVVAGDAVTWALARDSSAASIAVTVMSNGALEAQLPGVKVHRTPVGDQHLQRAMMDEGASLGAEESGHILFADHPGGDGVFAALRMLQTLSNYGGSASSLFGGFRPMPRQQVKVPVSRRVPLDTLQGLAHKREEWSARLGTRGRVYLRYSGTEPVLRVLVEGSSTDVVAETTKKVEAFLRGAVQ